MDLWINLLKIVSMLFQGIFGALALVTSYKDDNEKITRWGRVALIGIVVSTIISLGLHGLETYKARQSEKLAKLESEENTKLFGSILENAKKTAIQQEESLGKTEKLAAAMAATLDAQKSTVREVKKTLYPIEQVAVAVTVEFPFDVDLDPYLERIQSSMKNGEFEFPAQPSALAPNLDNPREWLAAYLSRPLEFRIEFITPKGSLTLFAYSKTILNHGIVIRQSKNWLHANGWIPVPHQHVDLSGTISSVLDLDNSQVELTISPEPNRRFHKTPEFHAWVAKHAPAIDIATIIQFRGRAVPIAWHPVQPGFRKLGVYDPQFVGTARQPFGVN